MEEALGRRNDGLSNGDSRAALHKSCRSNERGKAGGLLSRQANTTSQQLGSSPANVDLWPSSIRSHDRNRHREDELLPLQPSAGRRARSLFREEQSVKLAEQMVVAAGV
jgi:hypothetical protein